MSWLSIPELSAHSAMHAALVVFAVGFVVSTLEYWVIAPSAFARGGPYAWPVVTARRGGWVVASLTHGIGVPPVRLILAVRLLAIAAALALPFGGAWFAVAIGVLALNELIFSWLRPVGDDGSDQMNLIIILTLFMTAGPHANGALLAAGAVFIAAQSVLAYFASGVSKLASPHWRRGDTVLKIVDTWTYGAPWAARLLRRHPRACWALTWSVMLIESAFPLVLLLPEPWAWSFLVIGVAFHTGNALVMGLNSFFWAFLATYPCVVWAARQVTLA